MLRQIVVVCSGNLGTGKCCGQGRFHCRRVEELDGLERNVEDAGADNLEVDLGNDIGSALGDGNVLEGKVEFSPYRSPLDSGKVVVLEDEHQGGRAERRGVSAQELRLARIDGTGAWGLRGRHIVVG